MDKNPVTNILILAPSGANAEQVVNLIRKSGLSVFARKADSCVQLAELIGKQQWDLMLLIDCDPGMFTELNEVLLQSRHEFPALLLHSQPSPPNLPAMLAIGVDEVVDISDTEDKLQVDRLLHTVTRELTRLHELRAGRRATAALKDLEKRYQLLLANASDAVSYLHDGVHVYANAAYMDLFGYHSTEDMISTPLLNLVAEDDIPKVKEFLRKQSELDNRSCAFQAVGKDGRVFNAIMDGANVPYEGERALQLFIRPATGNTELKNAVRQIHNRDLLTGLLNRSSMHAQIEHAISDVVYERKSSTLLLIQLQNMDEIALVMGRPATNLLLGDIGSLLQKLLPADAVAGRLQSNELAVLIPELSSRDKKWLLALHDSINANLQPLVPQTLQLFAISGTAAVTADASDAEVILGRARYNISVQKNQRRLNYDGDGNRKLAPEEILKRMQGALSNGDFVLAFQPVVNLKADGLEHYEIRIRMRNSTGNDSELIYPPDFLEMANQHGLGEEIDRWVILSSLELLKSRNTPQLRLTINVTQNSITGATLIPWLVNKLHVLRQSTEQLILQISELDIISAPEKTSEFSRQLQEIGIKLAVTHFGCSLDPFRHLALVNAHFVKLDKALIQDLGIDAKQLETLQLIISRLHASSVQVIAPMIDQMGMLPLLWQANVNMVQGNCLQEPSDNMDFTFMQDEEITLRSFS